MSHSDPFSYSFSIKLQFPASFSMPDWIARYVTHRSENGWLTVRAIEFSPPPIKRFIESLGKNGVRLSLPMAYDFSDFRGTSDEVCGYALEFFSPSGMNSPDTYLLNPESEFAPDAPHGGDRSFGLLPGVSPNLAKKPHGKLSKANGLPIMPRVYFKGLEESGVRIGSRVRVQGEETVWYTFDCNTRSIVDPQFTCRAACARADHEFRSDFGILVSQPAPPDSFGWIADRQGWGCLDYHRLFLLDHAAFEFLHPSGRKMAGWFSFRPVYLPESPEARFLKETQEAIQQFLYPDAA